MFLILINTFLILVLPYLIGRHSVKASLYLNKSIFTIIRLNNSNKILDDDRVKILREKLLKKRKLYLIFGLILLITNNVLFFKHFSTDMSFMTDHEKMSMHSNSILTYVPAMIMFCLAGLKTKQIEFTKPITQKQIYELENLIESERNGKKLEAFLENNIKKTLAQLDYYAAKFYLERVNKIRNHN